ncbi:hypothetical protein L6452_14991 [Arctium lappa]|uniref:Uncharacterized protein n=1 Tax=Arctium lappa TaxID=4217 RepID=A0ACB9CN44_ARCLA|nr:hypothetical protein L6452_14991 [Arctium lappa]
MDSLMGFSMMTPGVVRSFGFWNRGIGYPGGVRLIIGMEVDVGGTCDELESAIDRVASASVRRGSACCYLSWLFPCEDLEEEYKYGGDGDLLNAQVEATGLYVPILGWKRDFSEVEEDEEMIESKKMSPFSFLHEIEAEAVTSRPPKLCYAFNAIANLAPSNLIK